MSQWINYRKQPPEHAEFIILDLGDEYPLEPGRYFCHNIPTVPYFLIQNGGVKIWPDDYSRILYCPMPERATPAQLEELMK